MAVSIDDIAWARQALADGRSMSFIASVLEMPERRAQKFLFRTADANLEHELREPAATPEPAPQPSFRTRPLKLPDADMPPPRRRRVLRRQFARHWDMIWFLRAQHMSGRVLRSIYGAEALIWSVGGGIDAEI